MSYIVTLYKDRVLNTNNKYRVGISSIPIWTNTVVNVGNFASLDLFFDNAVDISCDLTIVHEATHIGIQFGRFIVIGEINSKKYNNNKNITIGYTVDPYTSARISNLITHSEGLCARTNLKLKKFNSNLQSEPVVNSDISVVNIPLTEELNNKVNDFEGLDNVWNGLMSAKLKYILTVSPAIIDFLGIEMFETPGDFEQKLKPITNFNFNAADTTLHSGGIYRGTPIKFDNIIQVRTFIKKILGGCGFITKLPPTGMPGQDMLNNGSMFMNNSPGGGNVNWVYKNTRSETMESIRPFDQNDIYNLYCIPEVFAKVNNPYFHTSFTVQEFNDLSRLHKFGVEDESKYKFMCYPYYYNRLVTANSDTINIIPQTHYKIEEDKYYVAKLWVRYVGGDSPKLQGYLCAGENQDDPTDASSAVEWFTIRNYPSIGISVNNTYNPQLFRDMENKRVQSAVYNNTDLSLSPFAQTARASRNPDSINPNAGIASRIAGGVVGVFAREGNISVDMYNRDKPKNYPRLGTLLDNNAQYAADVQARMQTATNFITPIMSNITGNDFSSQISVPPFAAYKQGMTDNEMFAACRTVDIIGQSCNCIINPITDSGDIFGGEGVIYSVDGKTYYKFSQIIVQGDMPVQWREAIQNMFMNGVYLHDFGIN